MHRPLILAAALLLTACQTTRPAAPVPTPPDPCPASAAAALEPRISQPPLTDQEQLALDVGGIRILGADRYAGRELGRAQADARTARLESRIEQTRRWCDGRRAEPLPVSIDELADG